MKKLLVFLLLFFVLSTGAVAQIPVISVITTLVKKVINAFDLEVERLQNQTVWLQNAQKVLENEMSKLQLDGITDWVQKQKDLYAEYYQELSEVKQIIAAYDKVKRITELQGRIVSAYQSAYALFKQDKHFSTTEIEYMGKVYAGIVDESLKNLDQVLLVINGFVTQMTDAGRLGIIDRASDQMQHNYNDLQEFSNQNIRLSLQRSADANDLETIKNLYGLK